MVVRWMNIASSVAKHPGKLSKDAPPRENPVAPARRAHQDPGIERPFFFRGFHS
jgi:hypothetical protein